MSKTLPLLNIQRMQFADKTRAESCLLEFLKENEDASIRSVELLPKPESLNSINGFISYANGDRYFFKAHVEENEKLEEYYNASQLAQAGYPVITAKRIKQRPGQQIALYEIVSLPTFFDLIKIEEDKQLGGHPQENARNLVSAQIDLDRTVCRIYRETLSDLSAKGHNKAPVHQLFSHRLQDDGRVGLFYRGKRLALKEGPTPFETLANLHWTINGAKYDSTLEEIIQRSRRLLAPAAGQSVIGHGDAHNGNIFVDTTGDSAWKLVMFDPAFAGRHDPLLDMTKPLFHNIFARWMYFPEQVDNEFDLSYKIRDNEMIIEHSFQLSPLRRTSLESKLANLLKPTLQSLRANNALRSDWCEYLRSALFCCPFLTVNLFAQPEQGGTLAERYNLAIKLLGLSMAVEFGSTSHVGSNHMNEVIDEVLSG